MSLDRDKECFYYKQIHQDEIYTDALYNTRIYVFIGPISFNGQYARLHISQRMVATAATPPHVEGCLMALCFNISVMKVII